ncbi:hypothetical protein [Motilimonas sp. E26]|uniref:hypothetical protein n=1 Tax=Motilimonas sp. E26 TaxID=2865674 RepID=UPI001E544FAA|nr:hypothetical protein [Motilimonas sp. E26]MCE0558241.1 hypothetical protein [Motilimonas sp. E26]
MRLSSFHKIWINLLTLAALVMSGSASSSAMMNMQMTSLINNTVMVHQPLAGDVDMGHEQMSKTKVPHCNEQMMSSPNSAPLTTTTSSADHCSKMAANDCCPAVCISLALPLTPSEQLIVRQPHRTQVAIESAGQVIVRASSLYRPPIS